MYILLLRGKLEHVVLISHVNFSTLDALIDLTASLMLSTPHLFNKLSWPLPMMRDLQYQLRVEGSGVAIIEATETIASVKILAAN